jgi:hypothetical protein
MGFSRGCFISFYKHLPALLVHNTLHWRLSLPFFSFFFFLFKLISNNNLFLMVLEPGKWKMADLVSGKGTIHRWHFLQCLHVVEGTNKLPWNWSWSHSQGSAPPWSNHFPEASPLTSITSVVRFQHANLREMQRFRPQQSLKKFLNISWVSGLSL